MRILELFAGTGSFSKVARSRGHFAVTVDNDPKVNPDVLNNVMDIKRLPCVDVLWASPPCTCFSVASISRHWTGGKEAYQPKTWDAQYSIDLVKHLIELINGNKPKIWIIENPRGVLRKLDLIPVQPRTAWYCQYGDTRAKPTDIWTNLFDWYPKQCHNGNKDHEEARRGSKTGTQGLKDARSRGVVPPLLCHELLNECERVLSFNRI